MDALNDIIEQAMRLPPEDRRRIARAIDPERPPAPEKREPDPDAEERRSASLRRLMALGGKGHSDFTDVSGRTDDHLADIYAGKHAARDGK